MNSDWMKSKDYLENRVINMQQISGIREYTIENDTAQGTRTAEMYNGAGLRLQILKDRGMDISDLTYKGIPLFWKSFAGITTPSEAYNQGIEWLKSWYGGFLVTCGMTHMGRPCIDQGEELNLHGRFSNLRSVTNRIHQDWKDGKYRLEIEGTIKEGSVTGHNIKLNRCISTEMDSKSFVIRDRITNCGNKPAPHGMLYHFTIGYPLVNEESRIIYNADAIEGLDDNQRDSHNENFKNLFAPDSIHNGSNQDFIYINSKTDDSNMVKVALFNDELELGILLEFSKEALPYLGLWEHLGECGEYAISFEPMNSGVEGRAVDREKNRLVMVDPGEIRDYSIRITVLDGKQDLDNIEKAIASLN